MATATINTRSIQGESLDAVTDRLANLAFREGVIDADDGSYSVAQDTGANMQIKVGSGSAFDRAVVEGDLSGQGNYICEHQNATVTLTISASDPTNDRIDVVVLRVYDDTFDSSGLDESDIEVVQGTPAASPSAPAVPSGALKLAEVEVGNGVTAITNANITDFRIEAPTRGQLIEIVKFTTSGSFVKANYPWLARVRARVQGGGGAGGGTAATAAGEANVGGGGGGGGYAEAMLDAAELSASETVTVGTGGAGVSGAAGGSGGTSSFGAHTSASGGGGGDTRGPTSTAFGIEGGNGGNGTTGDLTMAGTGGSPGWASGQLGIGGTGGASPMGGGAKARRTNAAGQNPGPAGGGLYGGGGSGRVISGSVGAGPGADGANGIVILELYA